MEFLADLHPIVVHFPIAILILYSFIEIVGISINKELLLKMAHLLLAIGVVSAIGGVLTGNQASALAEQINENEKLFPAELIDEHETFATITLWFFAAMLFLRTYLILKKKFIGIFRYIFIPLTIIGTFFIYQTGEYGSKLVYDYGVGTRLMEKEINSGETSEKTE